jgi:hypothetical protein
MALISRTSARRSAYPVIEDRRKSQPEGVFQMAQATLWIRSSVFLALMMGLLASVLSSGRADDKPVGMTLLFQSSGMQVGVLHFDPDGRRGPVPGAVGGMYPRGGKEMVFMPGDSKHGLPTFVDVEWMVATPEYDEKWKILSSRGDKYSKQWIVDADAVNAKAPHHTKRVDLTSIITPELVDQVRLDRHNTQLKLIITFNNDDVDIKALAYKWR